MKPNSITLWIQSSIPNEKSIISHNGEDVASQPVFASKLNNELEKTNFFIRLYNKNTYFISHHILSNEWLINGNYIEQDTLGRFVAFTAKVSNVCFFDDVIDLLKKESLIYNRHLDTKSLEPFSIKFKKYRKLFFLNPIIILIIKLYNLYIKLSK